MQWFRPHGTMPILTSVTLSSCADPTLQHWATRHMAITHKKKNKKIQGFCPITIKLLYQAQLFPTVTLLQTHLRLDRAASFSSTFFHQGNRVLAYLGVIPLCSLFQLSRGMNCLISGGKITCNRFLHSQSKSQYKTLCAQGMWPLCQLWFGLYRQSWSDCQMF